MSLNETRAILEELLQLGLVEKRIKNGFIEWRITDKGRGMTKKKLKPLLDEMVNKK
jgi:predicted transcriptional regulator with HTH domain